MGVILAWVLVRYRFPLKQLLNGMIELPFALPTAVAGIALTSLTADTGLFQNRLHGTHHKGNSHKDQRYGNACSGVCDGNAKACEPFSDKACIWKSWIRLMKRLPVLWVPAGYGSSGR